MKNAKKSFTINAIALAVAACFSPLLLANPIGPTVVGGAATFATTGNTLTVTNTPGAMLNWQQFNIAAGQTTRFIQQSAQSSVLNRVTGPNPSQIFGSLQSNGQVYLINPNGILFGAGAQVDVAGLIASTMNITNADFLLNRLNFNGANGTASVLNQGTITTPFGGSVYLIGNNVTNEGVITTPQGNVVLAAGNSVSMVNTVTPHVSVTLSAPNGGQAVNLGQVSAQGGSINIYGALVKQQGLVSADSASLNAQGQVVLSATQIVDVAAGSVTSAANSNGTGGAVQILGNQVNVGGTVDASGSTGGGTILIGGDFQGKNAAVQNAANTTILQGALFKADATLNGNGGKVVVWANNSTTFDGYISARGGLQGGNGGSVEVSGKQWLRYAGLTDTRAPLGKSGSLLLDPTDITISTAADTPLTNNLGTFAATVSPSNLNTTTLQNQLALSNVTVDSVAGTGGTGLITIQSPIAWTTANALSLNAAGTVTINPGVTITNPTAGSAFWVTAPGLVNNGTIGTAQTNLYADTMALGGGTITSALVNLAPKLAAASTVTVNLGSTVDTTANTLELSNAELATISPSSVLQILGANITVSAPINFAQTGAGYVYLNAASNLTTGSYGMFTNNSSLTVPTLSTMGLNIHSSKMALTAGSSISAPGVAIMAATGVNMDLGSAVDTTVNTLELSNAELATITTNTTNGLFLGAQNITVSAPITFGQNTPVNLTAYLYSPTAGFTGMLTNNSSLTASNAAAIITLNADKMALAGGSINASTVNLLSNTVTGGPVVNGVNLGSTLDTALNTLELSNAELATITSTNLVIEGNNITVSAPTSFSQTGYVHLIGSNIQPSATNAFFTNNSSLSAPNVNNGNAALTGPYAGLIISADKMVLAGGAISAPFVSLTSSSLNFPASPGSSSINLGSTVDTTANTLELSSAELATITTPHLKIMSNNSTGGPGLITISSLLTLPSVGRFTLDGSVISDVGGTSGVVTPFLNTTSQGGVSLTGTGNTFGSFASVNTVSGNVMITDNVPSLLLGGTGALAGAVLTNSVGNIGVTNAGTITVNMATTSSPTGTVAINAAGGSLSVTGAGVATTTGTGITLNAAVNGYTTPAAPPVVPIVPVNLASLAGVYTGTVTCNGSTACGRTFSVTANSAGSVNLTTNGGPNGTFQLLSDGTFTNIALLDAMGNRYVFTGSVNSKGIVSGTMIDITGLTEAFTGNLVSGAVTFTSAQQACLINPASCTTTNTTKTNALTSNFSLLNTNTAIGNVTYSSSLKADDGVVWISYSDVRQSKNEARKAEKEKQVADEKVKSAKTPEEKAKASKEADLKDVEVEKKKADSAVRETEAEVRDADAEVRAAKTPEATVRAETRKAVAETKRAEADVKKADAEVKQAETEAKHASDPVAKAVAETKQAAAEAKKADTVAKQADVEAKKADVELKHAEAEAKTSNAPEAKAVVEQKKAQVEVKKAEAEVKKADAEVKKADAEVKQADTEAKHSSDPAVKAAAESKKVAAETKKADVEAKKADVEAKKADVELKHAEAEAKASDAPEAKVAVEQKKAEATVKKAEAEVKKAEAEVKKAEVEVKKASEPEAKQKAESKLAAAKESEEKTSAARDVKSEEKKASEDVKRAKEEVAQARTPEDKHVALKKIEATEAKLEVKRVEVEVQKTKVEVKQLGDEIKQVEVELKTAPPEQRPVIEQRIAAKRVELAAKTSDLEVKSSKVATLKEVAVTKEVAFTETRVRRNEMAVESFAGIDVAGMSRDNMKQVVSARHEFMKQTLSPALNILKGNPQAADLKVCTAGGSDVCIKPAAASLPAASVSADIAARVQLPLLTPTTSFLPQIQRKVAVVIGNNAYEDSNIPSLNGAINDADEVAKVFKDKMGYDVRVIHNGTRADIVRALNKVADETGSKDSVVLYYAGHGYQMDDTKMGYWIPSDASTSNPGNWISNSDINKMLTNITAKQTILVSDSCYSGAFTNEKKITSSAVDAGNVESILAKRSVMVMSSGGEEPVMDEGRDGHSIFAWHLMDKLGKVDQYKGGADVFNAVKAAVVQDAAGLQTPQYGASETAGYTAGGDYLFEVRKY
jgi:filamentous hemagglutinin family protein